MARGSCADPMNIDLFRQAQEEDRTTGTAKARDAAAQVCVQRCPLYLACRDYVLAAETVAGRWAGVWGGLTPEERRKIRYGRH